jgi:hypothetical protein
MMAIETELQAQVDAQLMEQGAFAPLDLLFNSGRLIYSDYEAWRRREIDLLDDVLMGDRAKILAEMERAAAYARSIGLIEQAQEFPAWDQDSADGKNKPLRSSAEPKMHRLIASRYLPAQNAPQMDLFFDNPVVALTNGIARALSARNLMESQRQLDRLYVQAPNHPDLAAFDQLVVGLDDLSRPVNDPATRLEFLNAIAPAARHLLGAGSRDYLSPLWKHLADALARRGFSPDQPNLHRSFALAQAQDWAGVSESIVGEAGWWMHAPLCLRLADSGFRRRRRVEALTAWCQLCWIAPERVADGVEQIRQSDLSSLWQLFLDCEEEACDDASEPALTPRDFPAWLLLHEPGLARQLSIELPRGDSPAEENYRCIHRWIHAHRAHRQQEEMALRKSLQQSHPVLFAVLKRSVEKG